MLAREKNALPRVWPTVSLIDPKRVLLCALALLGSVASKVVACKQSAKNPDGKEETYVGHRRVRVVQLLLSLAFLALHLTGGVLRIIASEVTDNSASAISRAQCCK